ncbi:MAG: alkaline phosphatase family protein [Clostridia bacterium]|nr:alkaline phosphatase family protein [Clostridia bacterium]
MKSKVILISIDGMRPDGVLGCGNPYVQTLLQNGSHALDARTVFPSVTLPCHMSMFHSVPPERHGITTNLYMPQVRPINGLFEQAAGAGLSCAMYYGWEPLRDVSRPGSLRFAEYINAYAEDATDGYLTDRAIARIEKSHPDFVFLYMVETDEKGGHDSGWMTQTYLDYISAAIDNARRVIERFGDEYTVIITADHGGHGRGHGSDDPQDMTIPMFFVGKQFTAGQALENVSILDLAPTIAAILEVPAAPEWEGKILVRG